MTVRSVTDMNTPIGEVLNEAGAEGLVVEAEGRTRYALIPLDEELLDYLIERSPKFIETCRQIRERMRGGKFHTHADVKKLLSGD